MLSDEAVRVAVAHRLGYKACEPHRPNEMEVFSISEGCNGRLCMLTAGIVR